MRNVAILFLVVFDEINAAFDLSMDVVIIWSIEVPPKDVLLVEHQLEELNQELFPSCIDAIDGPVYLLPSLAFIPHRFDIPV